MSSMLHPVLFWLPVALATAIAMDLWAALLHERVWHGPLWPVHRSHHATRRGRFEHNDLLSALHAPVAVAFILYGCVGSPGIMREVLYGVGIGMTAFGVAYVVMHDGVVHGRLPVRALLRIPYFRHVARAHRAHHAGIEGGPPYGLWLGPRELARHRKVTRARSTAIAPRRDPSGPPSSGPSRA